MLIGITAQWHAGYSGYEHLIDSADEAAIVDAVAGQTFRRASDALRAAKRAFEASADRRVRTARIAVSLRTARGDVVEIR
jgi:hypothetical protein